MQSEFFSGLVRTEESREFMATRGLPYQSPTRSLDFPPSFDPRPFVRIEDQRNRNSCVGNSLSSVGEACGQIDSGFKFDKQFSRWGAYIWAQQLGGMGGRDNGAMISGGVRTATEIGFVEESLWPYPADNERYSTREPAGAREAAAPFQMLDHTLIQSYDQGFEWMNQGRGPLWVGADWTTGLANNKGMITLSDLRSRVIGGHAYYFWGWDESGNWRLWNSHSVAWGDRGCRLIAPDAADYVCRRGEVYGMTDLKDVKISRPMFVDLGEGM